MRNLQFFTLCNICYVNEEQCYNLCLHAIKCHCLFIASAVDWNLQQADIKHNMGYRMAKKGRAAYNMERTGLVPSHTYVNLLCVCWKGLPFGLRCLLMSFGMFQAFAAGIISW
jgi:hypothetical protein